MPNNRLTATLWVGAGGIAGVTLHRQGGGHMMGHIMAMILFKFHSASPVAMVMATALSPAHQPGPNITFQGATVTSPEPIPVHTPAGPGVGQGAGGGTGGGATCGKILINPSN